MVGPPLESLTTCQSCTSLGVAKNFGLILARAGWAFVSVRAGAKAKPGASETEAPIPARKVRRCIVSPNRADLPRRAFAPRIFGSHRVDRSLPAGPSRKSE